MRTTPLLRSRRPRATDCARKCHAEDLVAGHCRALHAVHGQIADSIGDALLEAPVQGAPTGIVCLLLCLASEAPWEHARVQD